MPDPNNTVLEHFGLVFMPVCKAGNTLLIRNATAQLGKARRIDHTYPNADKAHIAGHMMGREFIRVALVRNPWARLVSCYADKVAGTERAFIKNLEPFGVTYKMPWREFVQLVCDTPDNASTGPAQHWRSMVFDLTYLGRLLPNVIGRMETLDVDWPVMRERVRQHCLADILGPLTVRNKSNHAPWRTYYEGEFEDLRHAVFNRFERDFQAFGYSWGRDVGPFTI